MAFELTGQRLITKAHHAVEILRARWVLRRAELGSRVYVRGAVLLDRGAGKIRIGSRCLFLNGPVTTELRCCAGARIHIGERCRFNYGVTIEAHDEVTLGQGCIVASGVVIRDRSRDLHGPVHIGEGVWLAHGAVVQPGVRIGDGAVVSARSVVTHDVPARCLAIGNPARAMPLDLVEKGRARAEAGPGAAR